jgi:hypothetical protein
MPDLKLTTDFDPTPADDASQGGGDRLQPAEARRSPRLRLPAMYTLVRVKNAGTKRYRWSGHAYDVSTTGMRFELDEPLDIGSEVELRAMLPGVDAGTFRAKGKVVRCVNDELDEGMADLGPSRMAITFTSFASDPDHNRLRGYLSQRGLSLPEAKQEREQLAAAA